MTWLTIAALAGIGVIVATGLWREHLDRLRELANAEYSDAMAKETAVRAELEAESALPETKQDGHKIAALRASLRTEARIAEQARRRRDQLG